MFIFGGPNNFRLNISPWSKAGPNEILDLDTSFERYLLCFLSENMINGRNVMAVERCSTTTPPLLFNMVRGLFQPYTLGGSADLA